MKKTVIIISLLFLSHQGDAESFFKRPGNTLGSLEETIKVLQSQLAQLNNEKDKALKAKISFALGVFSDKADKKSLAEESFKKSLEFGTKLGDYTHFFLAQIALGKKDFVEARKHFTAVAQFQPPSVRRAEAELELARIAEREEKWVDALRYLKLIEKKYRRDMKHPDILQQIFNVAQARKIKSDACAAALKMYMRYPMQTVGQDWGMDLSKVGCTVRMAEQEKRFTQLLITGEVEQVRKEIIFWAAKTRGDAGAHPNEMSFYESQLGRVSMSEGKISESIQHFLTAQDMAGRSFKLQMLLGRAYSQTDNYADAIDAYMRAFEMSPRSKQGLASLFQAAFLSYQNLDYDGAARRFEELLKRARANSKIANDTKWHLAWIRYLKQDYDGALRSFNELSQRRGLQALDVEKLTYWRAMSQWRLGFVEEARVLFTQLAVLKRMGYYTAAAQARLAKFPAQRKGPELIDPKYPMTFRATLSERSPASEDDSLNTATEYEQKPEEEETTAVDTGLPTESVEAAPEELMGSTLKDPAHVFRFERAKDLMDLGFDMWARAELREIESRTRNLNYLQTLMTEYPKVGEFHRSAYIADVTFSNQREKLGITEGASFWTHAFPQAYSRWVNSYSKKYDVPASLVWSVMRGESAFKEDIHSIAGAMGLMQLIPPTGKKIAESLKLPEFKREILLDPETNIKFGSWYLQRLSRSMKQKLPLMVASYNAGPHRVQGWLREFGQLDMDEFIEHIPYMETRNYVKKVLRNYYVYTSLYEKKTNSLIWLTEKFNIKVTGPKPSSENWDEI